MKKNRSLSIVHINTHDVAGGAAKVAWQLAEAQIDAGDDSRMVVGIKNSNSDYSTAFSIEPDLTRQSYCMDNGQLYYNLQGSHRLITNPIVSSADIVHLHNLHGGYFNPFSLSTLSHLKPVVWTLHDMQAITGHCAYSVDCHEWQNGCRTCSYLERQYKLEIDSSAQLLKDKKLIYDHSFIQIVTPSVWLKDMVEQSVLRDHPIELVYNGINTNIFRPYDKVRARSKFGIKQNVLAIGAVANGSTLGNHWKGGSYTQAALDILHRQLENYVFVNIGGTYETDDNRIINIGHINNERELAQAYSTLDIFLYTPIADNCPLVILEALSCGIPIVTFDTGGIPELVCDGQQGFVTSRYNQHELVEALKALVSNRKLCQQFSRSARERAVSKFDHKITAKQYEDLYKNVLEESKHRNKEIKVFPMHQIPKVIITKAFEEAEKFKEDLFCQKTTQFTQNPNYMQTGYDVSIVLCTKDRAPLLDQTLASLKNAIKDANCEIIVVEGNSSDNTCDILKKHEITKIYNETDWLGNGRHSWPQLYNFGFSKANSKWAMYASDDIVFSKDCITKAINTLNKQKDEVAGGIFFYKNTHSEPGWDIFGIDFTYGPKLLMNYGLVRLDYFRQVGGLDKAYCFYCADGDLCFKLYESGKQFIPLPDSFIVHDNILDNQKTSNVDNSRNDIELYINRWKHFVSAEMPKPRRLLWQEDFIEAFNLPSELRKIDQSIEHFWHGLSCFQHELFEQAKLNFLQAVKSSSINHHLVITYLAKAAQKCGDNILAERTMKALRKIVPDLTNTKDSFEKQEHIGVKRTTQKTNRTNRLTQTIQPAHLSIFRNGVEHLKCSRPLKAINCFEQINNKIPDLNYAKAVAHVQLGQVLQAESACKEELLIEPNHRSAKILLSKIQRILIETNQNPSWPENTYLISHTFRFIYCPIPKVACTNLKMSILDINGFGKIHRHYDFNKCDVHGNIHTCAEQECTFKSKDEAIRTIRDNSYFKFVFVRNPWSRLVSTYIDKIARLVQAIDGKPLELISEIQQKKSSEVDLTRRVTFRQFLEYIADHNDMELDEHWRPQASFIGANPFDFIGKYENLQADLNHINTTASINLNVSSAKNTCGYTTEQMNDNERRYYADFYSDELEIVRNKHGGFPTYKYFYPPDLRQLVRERFRKDIEMFGYSFNQ